MLEYILSKDYRFSNKEVDLMAETCFNHFEGVNWKSGKTTIAYWPSVAKRWVNGEVAKNYKRTPLFGMDQPKPIAPTKANSTDETLRERIRRQMKERKTI